MRTVARLFLGAFSVIAIASASAVAWLYFSQSGLPDISTLRSLAYPGALQPHVLCGSVNSVVISYESIGSNLRNALSVAEGPEDGPGVTTTLFETEGRPALAARLASHIYCKDEKNLVRMVHEIRTAIQIQRKYSNREIFTMLANSVYFGDKAVGVEAASQHYFRKHSAELSIAEAALLAGMIASPSIYSPTKHPDRALLRRNQVIDTMAQKRTISAEDAAIGKTAPMSVATN